MEVRVAMKARSKQRMKGRPGPCHRAGDFSLIELFTVVVVILIIAGIAIPQLARSIRNGYNFVYVAIDTGGTGKPDGFTINANSISPGQTGQKYFYADQTNVIRWKLGGPADSTSTPVPQ